MQRQPPILACIAILFRKYRKHWTEHNILHGLWGQMGLFRSKNNARLLYCLRQGRENQDCMQRQRPILSCIAIFVRKYRNHSTEHNILHGLWGQMVHSRTKNNASLFYFLRQKRENQDCMQRQRPILWCIPICFRKYWLHPTEHMILHGLWSQID